MSRRPGIALTHMAEVAGAEAFCFQKYVVPLIEGGRQKWKCWGSLNDALRLGSSCSSCVYAGGHSMKSLEKKGLLMGLGYVRVEVCEG